MNENFSRPVRKKLKAKPETPQILKQFIVEGQIFRLPPNYKTLMENDPNNPLSEKIKEYETALAQAELKKVRQNIDSLLNKFTRMIEECNAVIKSNQKDIDKYLDAQTKGVTVMESFGPNSTASLNYAINRYFFATHYQNTISQFISNINQNIDSENYTFIVDFDDSQYYRKLQQTGAGSTQQELIEVAAEIGLSDLVSWYLKYLEEANKFLTDQHSSRIEALEIATKDTKVDDTKVDTRFFQILPHLGDVNNKDTRWWEPSHKIFYNGHIVRYDGEGQNGKPIVTDLGLITDLSAQYNNESFSSSAVVITVTTNIGTEVFYTDDKNYLPPTEDEEKWFEDFKKQQQEIQANPEFTKTLTGDFVDNQDKIKANIKIAVQSEFSADFSNAENIKVYGPKDVMRREYEVLVYQKPLRIIKSRLTSFRPYYIFKVEVVNSKTIKVQKNLDLDRFETGEQTSRNKRDYGSDNSSYDIKNDGFMSRE